ncbi:protein of unknown function [Agrococcus baldri]|uniref:DUF4260 domain-containing protein n=1 Tax=Agrococcus baldri TaxID=153730 RepID=A0AA94KZ90_9MICO|nr:DUF4260 domain-containing protein [Agrococcus baldri]SFS08600.1 protein of unknown function [Agrococcus baldri]
MGYNAVGKRVPTGGRNVKPRTIVRIESGLIAVLAITGVLVIAPGMWWFPFAAFLVFDLSMLGYLRSPAVGAASYNAIHTYAWPAVLVAVALVTGSFAPAVSLWFALIALAWAFHVGIDRMLGYGLKLPDAFTHTHLGWIGKHRP